MKNAASLFLAVDRARTLIRAGSHPGAAYELAAREQGVDLDAVRRLVHRAQAGCDAAREWLTWESTKHSTAAGK